MMQTIRNQRGVSLITVVILILVLGMVSAAMVSMVNTESLIALHQGESAEALYVAQAGVEKALYQFETGTNCASLNAVNTLAAGKSFTTTGTLFNTPAPTVLSANITNIDTTIPLVSAAGYAPHGRVRIENEEIEYTAVSGNSLLGAQRGIGGTAAAAHLVGRTVFQNQCRIVSTGTVTGPLSNSQRVIEMNQVGMSSKSGSFTKSTGGAPASQSITGIGFQPKAIIFFWTRQTAVGFAPQNSRVNVGIGFATGPANERAVSITARDRRNNSDDGRRYSQSNAIIFLTNGGPPALVAQAELTSLDLDGFTIRWTTNDANPYLIHYIALGGDITNAFASTLNLTNVAGDQAVTGVGFQPDFVLFLWGYPNVGGAPGFDTNLPNAEIGLGFAKNATARATLVYSGRDGSGPNTAKRWQQRTDSAILLLDATNPLNQDAIVDFVSMDPDGFTVTKSDPPVYNNTPIFFLALKGGRHQVGAFNQPATTGNQSITGVGFQPQQLMLASFNRIANPNITGGGALSYGAARYPTARGNVWFQDRSDNDPSDANSYTGLTGVMTLAYGTAVGSTDGNPAVRAQADFLSFDPDGFTLNWTTADGTPRQILYWAIGQSVSTAGLGTNIGKIDWQDIY
jgi:Tfp pilus assembly protein PilX/predicted membrane protein